MNATSVRFFEDMESDSGIKGMKLIVPVIYGSDGKPLARASVRLNVGTNSWAADSTGLDGIAALLVDSALTDTQFEVSAQGYKPYGQHVNLGPNEAKQIRVGLGADPNRPQDIILPALEVLGVSELFSSGQDFIVDSARYKLRGMSDFLLLYKKANGQDIRPILSQRKALGADTLRIFTMCYNIQHFDPRDYDIYNILAGLMDDLSSFGMRGYIEGFADRQFLNMNDDFCYNHHNKIGEVLRGRTNALYDLVNEFEKNGIDPTKFNRLVGVICSSGSRTDNKPPRQPFWNFATYHPRRDIGDYYFSKWLTDIPNQAEVYYGVEGEVAPRCPIVPDEPIGFGYKPGRINEPKLAYRAGWLHTCFQNAAFYHCDQGIMSELLDDDMFQNGLQFFQGCADAFNKGV